MRFRAEVLALILASASVSTLAAAQPAEPLAGAPGAGERAAQLLESGNLLYSEEADYAGALEAFRASFELSPSWRALSGLALCQRALGDSVDAFTSYQKLLRDYDAELTEEQKDGARGVVGELEKEIGKISIVEVATSRPGVARVTLDGAVIAAERLAGPHLVTPGTHAVVATRDGFQPFAREVSVGGGETRSVVVELVPEKEKIIVKLEDAPLERRMPVWAPWATVGGGVALAGAGTLFALGARADFREFDDAVAAAAGELPTRADVDDGAVKSGERKRDVAIGLFIAGGVAAAVGVALAIVNQPRRVSRGAQAPGDSMGAAIVVSPAGVGLSMRF